MSLSVVIDHRDFSQRIRELSQVLRVNKMSWAAVGGPLEASISVRGGESVLWECAEWLRCPVTILNDAGAPIWWGYVFKVRIRTKRVETVLSLGPMANRIKADYSYIPAGQVVSTSAVTDWLAEQASITEYGTRERRFSFSQLDPEAVNNRLTTVLNEIKYPRPSFAPTGAEESLSALIECRGWWDTLNWKYYENNSGEESYTATGTGTQSVGTTASQKVRQEFQLAPGTVPWKATMAYIRVRRAGTPADSLRVAITDASDVELAYATVQGDTLPTALAWAQLALNTPVSLTEGVQYYVRVSRSGATDDTNYYVVDVIEPPGYPRGAFTYWDGSSWVARVPDADMAFRVTGVQEITGQLKLLITNVGQFFTGVVVRNLSTLYSNPYRDGQQLARRIAEDLLQVGTSNSRRLLARVLPSRYVEIYEEPDPNSPTHFIDGEFNVYTSLMTRLPPIETPVGVWARMFQIIPATVNTSRIADASLAFIEQTEYDVATNGVKLVLAGSRTLRDVGMVEQG